MKKVSKYEESKYEESKMKRCNGLFAVFPSVRPAYRKESIGLGIEATRNDFLTIAYIIIYELQVFIHNPYLPITT